jgi:hypothetical protein
MQLQRGYELEQLHISEVGAMPLMIHMSSANSEDIQKIDTAPRCVTRH